MPCVHLKELYQLCAQHDLKISGSDLIRVVCQQCGVQEVCPSVMTDEYEAHERQAAAAPRSATEKPEGTGPE